MLHPARAMEKLTHLAGGVNAYTLSFDDVLLNDLRTLYDKGVRGHLDLPSNSFLCEGGKYAEGKWQQGPYGFYACSYDDAPLLWVSNDNLTTYDVFNGFFRSLDIVDEVKQLIDFENEVVVYCGFFVVGDHLPEAKWHVDYFDGANAFTLIAPLFQPVSTHGDFLYRDNESIVRKYRYKRGEAIILGDRFPHTTEPYPKTSSRRVLLSLTFGTDKLEHWRVLKETVGRQSNFLVLPCGHQKGACDCLRNFADARDRRFSEQISDSTNLESSDRFVISPQVVCREADGATVLLAASGERCAALDPIGAHMWRLLAEYGRSDAVRAEMLAQYDVEAGQLDRDLLQFVRSLADAGLIVLERAAADGA